MEWSKLGVFTLISLGLSSWGQAQHKGISFQGVIKLPGQSELPTDPGVTVRGQILSSNDCVLSDETFTGVNISNGYINLPIGKGSRAIYDPGLSLAQVMDNSRIIANGPSRPSGLVCLRPDGSQDAGVTAYNPSTSDGARKFRISLYVKGVPVVADFNMRAMAYAVNSESLNGKKETDFIQINTVQGVTQAKVESVFLRYTKLDEILNNFSSPVGGGSTPSLGVDISGNAQTATLANHATTATTATQVSGVVGIANGGTGANSVTQARQNLGLGPLAELVTTGTASNTTYLRGDGEWAALPSGGATVTEVTMSGDVSGLSSAAVVDRLKGVPVASVVAADSGKYLKYVSPTGWQAADVRLSELKNFSGTASAFADMTSCGAAQTLVWSSITDQLGCQNIVLTPASVNGLSAVASSGAYSDLTGRPSLHAVATSGSYTDLINRPVFATVATSGAYADLTGVPTLGSLAQKNSVALDSEVSGILPVANGGTGASSVAAGMFFAGAVSATGAPSFRQIASEDLPSEVKYWSSVTGGIAHNGNVGIGAIGTVSERLVVNGKIQTDAVRYNWVTLTVANNNTTITGNSIFVDTSGGSFSVVMKAAVHGESVKFVHAAGNLSTQPFSVKPPVGSTIVGEGSASEGLILDINHGSIELIFFDPNGDGNGDWRIM